MRYVLFDHLKYYDNNFTNNFNSYIWSSAGSIFMELSLDERAMTRCTYNYKMMLKDLKEFTL